jgi:hypothetical protein
VIESSSHNAHQLLQFHPFTLLSMSNILIIVSILFTIDIIVFIFEMMFYRQRYRTGIILFDESSLTEENTTQRQQLFARNHSNSNIIDIDYHHHHINFIS